MARGSHWRSADLESEALVKDGVQTASVWPGRRAREKGAAETFVLEDGAWRWRPWPEYTLWAAGGSDGLFRGARHIVIERDGKWQEYTRKFVERYELNEEQTQAAWRVLRDCKEQRTQYLLEHRAQIRKLETALTGEKTARQREQALQEFERIKKSIERIFEKRLKAALEKLPTRQQRTAAEPAGG